MIEDIRAIKSTKKELREFGLTIGGILVILGALALWRGKCAYPYLLGAGLLLIVPALILPGVLKPLQKTWMAFGIFLGFFTSRIVLAVLFYLCMTPISFILKISGKDILGEHIDKKKRSYWIECDTAKKDKQSYENQY